MPFDETLQVVVLCQPNTPNAVVGQAERGTRIGLEAHKATAVKAIQTIPRSYPYHARRVLQYLRYMPVAQAVMVVIETHRIVRRAHRHAEYKEEYENQYDRKSVSHGLFQIRCKGSNFLSNTQIICHFFIFTHI